MKGYLNQVKAEEEGQETNLGRVTNSAGLHQDITR